MLLILIIIAFAALLILLFFFYSYTRKAKELEDKISLALETDDLIKIAFEGSGRLNAVARHFNDLGKRYAGLRHTLREMESIKHTATQLGGKLEFYESSISQITLLTDMGKDITASLDMESIVKKIHYYITSSLVVDEIQLLLQWDQQRWFFVANNEGIRLINDEAWQQQKSNILNWVFTNQKEVLLQEAAGDYEQYLYEPVRLYNGEEAASLICIPLGSAQKHSGSLAVLSLRKELYNNIHFDFIKSIGSYTALAADNALLFGALADEKKKSDNLLLNILPEEVAQELKEKGNAVARQFDEVTVLFTDFVDFTKAGERMNPQQLVTELHNCFKAFDEIIGKYNIEKIKTIGDAYLAVCGLPNVDAKHAEKIIKAAIEIRDFMSARRKQMKEKTFEIRMGIHSGPVVAGIVGVKKFAYDIWGDTVNTAARMEQSSEAGKINVSEATYELVKHRFPCAYRGEIEAKNKGKMKMYFVN